MAGALPGYDYLGVGRDDGWQAGEYSVIFYRKARFESLGYSSETGDTWVLTS